MPSEFAGQLLRVDGSDGIFLDVALLSKVLNPVVDHMHPRKSFEAHLLRTWKNNLVTKGVLSPNLTRHFWEQASRTHAPQSSTETVRFENALFHVLIKLGVAFPLSMAVSPGQPCHPATGRRTLDAFVNRSRQPAKWQRDMLVRRCLPQQMGDYEEAEFNTLVEKLEVHGAREVTVNWDFDFAGAPGGLVERLIARCHVIGEAEKALCWRSGVVFKNPRIARRADPLYAVRMDYSNAERMLSVRWSAPLRTRECGLR